MVDLSVPSRQADFGDMVGVSQQAVSELVSRGVLTDGASAGDWLRQYCANLREQAAGRGSSDLAIERARLAKEQADKIAMQNAQTRRELAPVVLMTEVLAKVGARVSGILDAIPGQVRRRVPSIPVHEIDAIAREIARARNMCAAIRLEDLDELDQDDSDPEPEPESEVV
mgnify:CR=1 FL=1